MTAIDVFASGQCMCINVKYCFKNALKNSTAGKPMIIVWPPLTTEWNVELEADNEQKDRANKKLVYRNTLVHKQSIKIQCSFPSTRESDKPTEVMSQLFRQLE